VWLHWTDTLVQAKEEEWRGVRRDMNKIWKEVYERNYLKSLDHRSFYFKQIDKRNLSSKGLVSEMRALVEAGTPAVVLYPCSDVSLHKDVFDLIMMIAESDSRCSTPLFSFFPTDFIVLFFDERTLRVSTPAAAFHPRLPPGTTTRRAWPV
jgi:hypothetical protein